ncbi:hypothetical protein BG006_007666 [Podila minutissima]|uniref:Uncharacterized protein n=1 Tax=Podila minutissima TaxID=64525 RepID=A0A9P5SL51_9FUNG|nr:hypothetical protein BG006_007666 [Podila minutissima]
MRLPEEHTMSHRTHPTSTSSTRTRTRTTSMAWSILSLLVLTLSLTTYTDAALTPGFCGDCQTFSNAIGVCGGSFTKADIEIQTPYALPQSFAKCVCTEVMQKVLWTCKRCEELAGFKVSTPPPNAHRATCLGWGITAADYSLPYTGVVAPGTQGITGGGDPNPGPNPPGGGTNPPAGNEGTTSSVAPGQPTPSGAGGKPPANDGDGVNGAAVGISLGIIGIAAVGGGAAVFMMKRRRHARHAPLELGDHYVGLEDNNNWEKPARPSSPPMAPAPVASGAPLASRGPMQGRPSPFEKRPGGNGSVVGGYDGQYDQYDHYHHGGGSQAGGYNDGYNQGGQYDQNYYQGHGQQGYGPPGYSSHHDYGYDHTVPTSGPGGYPPHPPGKGGDGQYM